MRTRLAVMCLFITVSLAESLTLKEYLANKDKYQLYVTGIGQGFLWADVHFYSKKNLRLYCRPWGFQLNTSDVRTHLLKSLPS